MKESDRGRQARLEQLAILSRAVESTHEGFVTIDENHKVIFFNRAAERIFGYRRREVIGKDLNVILSPGCSPAHHRAVQRYVRAKRPRSVGHPKELTARRKDGSSFPCSISFSVARVKGRLFFTGVVRDLSQTKALQEQIVKAERLAALGQTVAEINHEIRNPMVIIGGFVRQLIKTTRDPRALSKLRIMADEVQRVENLLLELRDLYLPRKLRKKTVDLIGILEEVYALARQSCKGTNVRLRLEARDGPIFVRGDREKLKQVFLNVVKNSIEAVGTEGNVTIRVEEGGGRARVTVEDDGPGMTEEVASRIFSPFFTTKKEGTGLGLCISKRIIEEHRDSSLEVISEPGAGTTVRIEMPVRTPSPRRRRSEGEGRAVGDRG